MPSPGWSSAVPSPRVRRCGSASWSSGRIIIAAGTPARLEALHDLARRQRPRPVVERPVTGDAPQRLPLRVVARRDHAPLVVAGARVDGPRLVMVLAERSRQEDVGELVEDQLGLGDFDARAARPVRRRRISAASTAVAHTRAP